MLGKECDPSRDRCVHVLVCIPHEYLFYIHILTCTYEAALHRHLTCSTWAAATNSQHTNVPYCDPSSQQLADVGAIILIPISQVRTLGPRSELP